MTEPYTEEFVEEYIGNQCIEDYKKQIFINQRGILLRAKKRRMKRSSISSNINISTQQSTKKYQVSFI